MARVHKAELAVADDVEVEVDAPNRPASPPRARRRGRPADSDGRTRQRILAAAQECFAESGYAGASTHMVAARVGLTTGALYHHFGSKRELYLAVLEEAEQTVYGRFRAATEPHGPFGAKVAAVLEEAAGLHVAEPTLAGFVQSVTSDVARHPDLREEFASSWTQRDTFLSDVVKAGVASGEIRAADRAVVLDTLATLVTGLVVAANVPAVTQGRALEGLKRLMAGTLFKS